MTGNTVHANPWFGVTLTNVEGQEWFRVERCDSAMLIGTTDDGLLLTVRGTRDTTGTRAFVEFPSGAVDVGEDPLAAAVRETMEETGYEAIDPTYIGSFVESPGISAARCHLYASRVSFAGPAALEPGENWKVELLSRDRLLSLIKDGHVLDAGTLAAVALSA